MRVEQIKTALREGLPFEITTAAGDKFMVNQAHQLAFVETGGAVSVVTDDGLVHVIPLLTMTSLTYLRPAGGASS
ncbi:MAG: hypothetical protein FJ398_24040 [Verrucomicrobia bacterium]|nr:hypothetical protein [Verrucomicrobiota bacterium]